MPPKKVAQKTATARAVSAPISATAQAGRGARTPPPTVSGRWLLTAVMLSVVAAAFCGWGALCLLFWQGSWQLLYHPSSAITRTPASAGLAFDPVGFATTEAAEQRLKGWWIPAGPEAKYGRFTVLYLHGQDGNLSDSIETLSALHKVGLNVFAFDYRGYGQSQFQRPSEARWREDADWAIRYLTETRHVAAGSIVLDGRDLGANLALEVAAAHPELAGVVLESPLEEPMNAIFNDSRAHMVPAHLLVRDRFDSVRAAAQLKIPSMWIYPAKNPPHRLNPEPYQVVTAVHMLVWQYEAGDEKASLPRWLDDLGPGSLTPLH